jgi:hypothetical protein
MAMEYLFGFGPNGGAGQGGRFTVRKLVRAVTSARSQVLHGVWLTLGTDLPGHRDSPSATRAEVETLVRDLLITFPLSLGTYAEAGETDHDVEAILRWAKARRDGATRTDD